MSAATPESAMTGMAMAFDFMEMAPRSRQATTPGPSQGCLINHRSSLGDDRAKHAAARINKGTPGRMGRMTPATPMGTNTMPMAFNNIRI